MQATEMSAIFTGSFSEIRAVKNIAAAVMTAKTVLIPIAFEMIVRARERSLAMARIKTGWTPKSTMTEKSAAKESAYKYRPTSSGGRKCRARIVK